jgi:hypothetical protein
MVSGALKRCHLWAAGPVAGVHASVRALSSALTMLSLLAPALPAAWSSRWHL